MEEGAEKNGMEREEIFSKIIRAGKRTYFFDVKSTRKEELYLTITESKKIITDSGKFIYEKHKVFLYKEDFDRFTDALSDIINRIKTKNFVPDPSDSFSNEKPENSTHSNDNFSNVNFEDLDK